jgi:formylglycine-generating enzyme required for sulfatase activity
MGAQGSNPLGLNFDANALAGEGPAHEVELSPFLISKYEMTQAQWYRSTGQNPSYFTRERDYHMNLLHPVERINWYQSEDICRRLDLALPSEAQWEYSARAGTTTPWWTGGKRDDLLGAANLADQAAVHADLPWPGFSDWPELDDGYSVHAPVNTFRPNPFGLHSVHGNVWEWCGDSFAPYDAALRTDPERKPIGREDRVLRGGSFEVAAQFARSSYRHVASPEFAVFMLGLRPARRWRE